MERIKCFPLKQSLIKRLRANARSHFSLIRSARALASLDLLLARLRNII